jgi:hypothetical protein
MKHPAMYVNFDYLRFIRKFGSSLNLSFKKVQNLTFDVTDQY